MVGKLFLEHRREGACKMSQKKCEEFLEQHSAVKCLPLKKREGLLGRLFVKDTRVVSDQGYGWKLQQCVLPE